MKRRRIRLFLIESEARSDGSISTSVAAEDFFLEVEALPVDEAKAKAKLLLEERGYVVRQIAISVKDEIVAYARRSTVRPVHAVRQPGWVFRPGTRAPRP
jgi:hypothetical protein